MTRRLTILALAAAIGAALMAATASGAAAGSRLGYRSAPRPAETGLLLAQSRRYYNNGPVNPRRNFAPRPFSPRNFSPRGYRYSPRPSTTGRLPMSVVASRALACHPGRILDARLQGSTYVFKILTRRGRLVRVYGDARTGAVSCR